MIAMLSSRRETDVILDTRRVTTVRQACLLNPEGNKVAIVSQITAAEVVTKILHLQLDQSAGNCCILTVVYIF